ncbi:pentapeptide repeat-containing protein [Sulfurimonas sp. HSL3-7]|uniref:pentapeptide repeat-containing protein n=1 Tax=Sulfonitrofixus jiaomeiensis TaxID=3131938 RepID=UPI0031F739E5
MKPAPFQEDNFAEEFIDLDLSEAEIVSKEFEECTFINCDFSEAQLRHCIFDDCRFLKCNLSVVKVDGSRFSNVVFEESKLSGIDWTKAAYSEILLDAPFTFINCIVDYASFYGLTLQSMVIRECKAYDVDFRECDLSGADLRETDLTDTLFRNTNLSGADLTLAENYTIDINVNTIKGARFSRYEALTLLEGLEITLVD